MSHTETYTVTGMTCSHCAASVTEEISGLEGIEMIDVDVDNGKVTVKSHEPLDREAVKAAVDEAGYELV